MGMPHGGNAMKVLVKGLLGAVALAGFSLPAYAADTTLTTDADGGTIPAAFAFARP